jgi:hypothetical protein
MRKALLIVTALMTGALPVSAGQGPATPRSEALLGALRNAQASNPYSKLFEVRSALKQAEQAAQKTAAPKRRVVCGMTVIEISPEIDPKMGVTPLKDDKTRHPIRAVEPPICNNQ